MVRLDAAPKSDILTTNGQVLLSQSAYEKIVTSYWGFIIGDGFEPP